MTSSNEHLESVADEGDLVPLASTGHITPEELHELVKRLVPAARDLELKSEDQYLAFWYEDQDADLLKVHLYIRASSLEVIVALTLEDDDWVAALEAANEWNWRQRSDGADVTLLALERPNGIFLRSAIPTRGGVHADVFEEWINSFLQSINAWEDVVFESLNDSHEDDDDGDPLDEPGADPGDFDDLRQLLVWAIPAARQVSAESGIVSFLLENVDGGSTDAVCYQSADHELVFLMRAGFWIGENELVQALMACNRWNMAHYPHESVAYVKPADRDEPVHHGVCIESSIDLNEHDFRSSFDTWAKGFVESVHNWRAFLSSELLLAPEEPKGEPLLARFGAGLAAVTPYIAKAAQVLGDAFIESLADDIRGKGKPAQRSRSRSARSRQRSGQDRQRSNPHRRQQRRPS